MVDRIFNKEVSSCRIDGTFGVRSDKVSSLRHRRTTDNKIPGY